MNRVNYKLYFLLIFIPLLTGCYNYQELNNLSIVTGTSIEMVDDKYKITIQVINPKKSDDAVSSNQPKFVTYSKVADTLQESYRNIVLSSSRRIYGSHINILIISTDIAKEDISCILDFIFRNTEMRKEFYVLLSSNPSKLLELNTPITNISSSNIRDTIESNTIHLASSMEVTFNDMMNMYLNPNLEIVLPIVEIVGDSNNGNNIDNLESSTPTTDYSLTGLGVFSGNKLLDTLDEEESITYNLITNNVNNTIIKYACSEDRYVTNKLSEVESSIDVDSEENKLVVRLNGSAILSEIGCDYDLSNPEDAKMIQDSLNNQIESNIKSLIVKYQEKMVDIFGFKDKYHKSNYKSFNKVKDNYEEVFKNYDLDIKSNIEIIAKGNVEGDVYEVEN